MFAQPRVFRPLALVSLLVLALFAGPARAQCGPDGLDGPVGACCMPASVVLPQFPSALQTQSQFICFDNCTPVSTVVQCINVGAPIPYQLGGGLVCGVYRIRMTVKNCGTTTTIWNGSVVAHYSRNWQESSVPGTVNLNVWRFVLNGDFLPTAALPASPFVRPPCNPTYSRVYFTGYMDYAFDCNTGGWNVAFVLDHECDAVHHQVGNPRPAPATGLHPTFSYTWVAPDAGFAVAATGTYKSDGPILQQSVRFNNWAAAPTICNIREPVQGVLQAQNEFCQCSSTAGAPNQYIVTNLVASSACGSQIVPSPNGLFLQKRIGMWTIPGTFPGTESALIDFGFLNYTDACNGIVTQQWFEGGETLGGYPAYDFAGLPLGTQFEDLGSANKSATSMATLIGIPHLTYYIAGFNLP